LLELMPQFTPEQLARWTGGRWTAEPSTALGGFAIDTRQLKPGEVFVALRTDKRDGHDFVGNAAHVGAGAAIVAQEVAGVALPQLVVEDPLVAFQRIAREHRSRFPGQVVGITGSAGKTSTKELLALLLGSEALATEGNLNNHLGVPLTLTRLDPARHRFAAIEAGISGPGEMAPLAAMIEPDVAVVTLIGPAHTQALGGLDGVAREKAVLPATIRRGGLAILPRSAAGYPAFQSLTARRLVAERVDELPSGEPPEGVVRYTLVHQREETVLRLAHPSAVLQFTLPRVSDGMAQNAVLALCAALELEVKPDELQRRLRAWAPPAMRGEMRWSEGRLLYLDCYNANPASMLDALSAFVDIAPADYRRLYVIGGMEELGAESARYHREIGQALQLREHDHVFVVGADAESVRLGAIDAGAAPGQVDVISSIEPLKARVHEFRGAVFVKGSRKYRLETIVEGPSPTAGSAH
jgi:UDP-N-acetylmuramoyl-tripeptide--D-alanyl-D-alanine ligase